MAGGAQLREKIERAGSTICQKTVRAVSRTTTYAGPGIYRPWHEERDKFNKYFKINKENVELPPLGIDFAFDFEVKSKNEFFLRDGQWFVRRDDMNYMEFNSDYGMIMRRKPSVWENNFGYNLMRHPSEMGWKFSKKNPRHLLKFPTEVLEVILGHLLVVPTDMTLKLAIVGFDKKRNLPIIQSGIVTKDLKGVRTVHTRHDRRGKFFEIRNVYRPVLSAACLRTCKLFHAIGIKLLYSNTLSFNTHGGKVYHRFARLQMSEEIHMVQEYFDIQAQSTTPISEWMPEFIRVLEPAYYDEEHMWEEINDSFHLVTFGIRTRLFGVYWPAIEFYVPRLIEATPRQFDTFLWFLNKIGTDNVARIKSLRLYSFQPEDDFQLPMIYLAFMKSFCTELKHLGIDLGWRQGRRPDDLNAHDFRLTAMEKLLKKELRELPALESLSINNVMWGLLQGVQDRSQMSTESMGLCLSPEYASQAMLQVKLNGDQRRRVARTECRIQRELEMRERDRLKYSGRS